MILSSESAGRPLSIIFMGCPDFAVPCLDALYASPAFSISAVYSMPDRPKGRGKSPGMTPVKERALALGLPVFTPPSFRRDPAEVERLASFAPDFLVVVAYGLILPESVLTIPRIAPVNLHASVLPKYRGPSPIHAAVLAGDKETGASVMLMNAHMDEGDILAIETLPIGTDETLSSLHDRLSVAGAPLLTRTLLDFANGKITPHAQNHSAATYTTKITTETARIDWRRPAPELVRLVRAMTPCPGAWFELAGERLKVGQALSGPAASANMTPGTIIHASPEQGFRIVCGNGTTLDLLALQRPGKSMTPIGPYLRGNSLSPHTMQALQYHAKEDLI
ncbi:MAG: methionyl-tRNA formyltransferase [Candidatus Riflebacteria bacterium]|nr:methionyl-tRNA formyltransferase [Candidatus Riflebacteria bacterium]